MSTPEPSPSTTDRPDWVRLGDSGERQILKWGGDPSVPPSPYPAPSTPLTTGAFVSRAISTRFEVAPSPWRNLATMFVLYGTFIGLPVVGGVWAALRILGRL